MGARQLCPMLHCCNLRGEADRHQPLCAVSGLVMPARLPSYQCTRQQQQQQQQHQQEQHMSNAQSCYDATSQQAQEDSTCWPAVRSPARRKERRQLARGLAARAVCCHAHCLRVDAVILPWEPGRCEHVPHSCIWAYSFAWPKPVVLQGARYRRLLDGVLLGPHSRYAAASDSSAQPEDSGSGGAVMSWPC